MKKNNKAYLSRQIGEVIKQRKENKIKPAYSSESSADKINKMKLVVDRLKMQKLVMDKQAEKSEDQSDLKENI